MQQRPEAPATVPSRRRAWVALAALGAVALTARLGWWQLDRAAQKQSLQAAQAAAAELPPLDAATLSGATTTAVAQRRAVLQGRWWPQHSVWLDNRPMHQRSGFILLTPLELTQGTWIWVQRGWQPKGGGAHAAPPWPETPVGWVTVTGRLQPQASRAYALGAASPGPIKQNLELADWPPGVGRGPLPWVLWQTAGCEPMACDWVAPDVGVAKHHGYAAQWFALSALTLGLYVWFQLLQPLRAARRAA